MKILHVVYDFTPGDFRGGIAKVVYELAFEQAQQGHEVTVFTPVVRQVPSTGLPTTNINVQTLQTLKLNNTSQAIYELTRQHDVVHSHNTFHRLNSYVAAAGRRSGTPAFFHVHGALDPVVVNTGIMKAIKKHIYIRLIERRNLNAAQGVFALTKAEEEQIRKWHVVSAVHVVPNGIKPPKSPSSADLEEFNARYLGLAGARVILYLGRINPKKGLELLIEAFGNVASKFPEAVLVLAGDRGAMPDYVHQLDTQIEKAGLQKRVIWTGFLNEFEKCKAFAMAEVFSHVTVSEGMAVAVLEAMAAGVPTIVSPGCYMEILTLVLQLL
ncbi:MAG: glycosyltransferase [Sphingobacteriales bacterium]|nr:MAG: glycosyltransferase [Sphingobacteriales bacterium]